MDILSYPLIINMLLLVVVAFFLLRMNNGQDTGKKVSGVFGKSKSFQPVVEKFTVNLTDMARQQKLDPVIGRDKEIKRVIQVLSRRKKNNIILFGKAGIGKTAVVEGLAIAIAEGKVPRSLLTKKVLKLDISSVLAGTKYRGEFENRFKALIDAFVETNKQIIVFIDEIHTIVQAGGVDGAVDADDIIKGPLARGDLQMLGTTTTKEYNQYIATDPTLTRRFEGLLVYEPSKTQTVEMLKALRKNYEDYHNVIIGDEVIKKMVELSAKIKTRVFPDKAIDIMDEVSAKVRLDNIDNNKKIKITIQDIKEILKDFK
ncbi:ATP-dependent Clp protease ATP-binding subunit [Candidatus Parcubacteria bacterium]|jgi:ATP-dependent Clp protease ATP-binding subunit ClpC|nr:ATP-dependent Clp protease ATP-binding subunit [Candidatus Parcubacteria bacterium]